MAFGILLIATRMLLKWIAESNVCLQRRQVWEMPVRSVYIGAPPGTEFVCCPEFYALPWELPNGR